MDPQEHARGITDESVVVRTCPACARCCGSGILLEGWKGLGRPGVRTTAGTLILLGAIVLFGGVFLTCWFPLMTGVGRAIGITFTSSTIRRAGLVFAFLAGGTVVLLPIRAIACSQCGRIVRFRFGRKIPLDWQRCITPNWRCGQCGYLLHGVEQPRCPECSAPFPESWLVFTAKGDPTASVTVDLE